MAGSIYLELRKDSSQIALNSQPISPDRWLLYFNCYAICKIFGYCQYTQAVSDTNGLVDACLQKI